MFTWNEIIIFAQARRFTWEQAERIVTKMIKELEDFVIAWKTETCLIKQNRSSVRAN